MARKCSRLCGFSSPQGECRKPSMAVCPAGLPTNEQKIRSMDLGDMARLVNAIAADSGVFCRDDERCQKALEEDRVIPDEWCEACAKTWLQQVAEEE